MRRFVIVLLAAAVALIAVQATRAYLSGHRDFERVPMKFEAPLPIEGHLTLKLKTKSGLGIAASFVPPKNGVAVIMGHGTDTNRTQLWADAATLTRAGIGIVALDWPGHGESEGEIHLGTAEREAFTACVDFLAGREDVTRIGAYGFSQGGGLLTAFVADEPRVTSLLAVNAWADSIEQQRYEYRRWGPIRQLPALAAIRTHVENGNLRSIEAAPRLKGRKTLFLASAEDEVVPMQMSQELAAAAGGRGRVIEGAHHTDFREHLPEWPKLLVEFFASSE